MDPQVSEISLNELTAKRERGEPLILVDVLSHEHFAHIHLPGSINLPLPVLRELAPLLFGREEQLIVYCAGAECNASLTAAKLLEQLGFTDVRHFSGGIEEWVKAGLPVMHMPHPPLTEHGEQAA